MEPPKEQPDISKPSSVGPDLTLEEKKPDPPQSPEKVLVQETDPKKGPQLMTKKAKRRPPRKHSAIIDSDKKDREVLATTLLRKKPRVKAGRSNSQKDLTGLAFDIENRDEWGYEADSELDSDKDYRKERRGRGALAIVVHEPHV